MPKPTKPAPRDIGTARPSAIRDQGDGLRHLIKWGLANGNGGLFRSNTMLRFLCSLLFNLLCFLCSFAANRIRVYSCSFVVILAFFACFAVNLFPLRAEETTLAESPEFPVDLRVGFPLTDAIALAESSEFDLNLSNLVINMAQQGWGTISFQPAQNTYLEGQIVTLTATPFRWYVFSHWLSNGVPIMASTNLVVTIGLTNNYTALFTNTVPLEWWTPKIWERSFGGNNEDSLKSLVEVRNGGFLLGGTSMSPPSGTKTSLGYYGNDFWVVRLNANGNKLWEISLEGRLLDYLSSLLESSDGGFVLAGANGGSMGIEYYDSWVVKLDAEGNHLWDQVFDGSSGDDSFSKVLETRDGGFLLGGSCPPGVGPAKTAPSYGGWDYWIVKVDSTGRELWQKSFGGSSADYLSCMAQTPDRGFLLGGTSASGISGNKTSPNNGSDDFWVIKLDGDGNKQWEYSYGGSSSDSLASLVNTSDGGFLLAGSSSSSVSGTKTSTNYGGGDYWVIKIDADGTKLWEQSIGGSQPDNLYSLVGTGDGGFLLGGRSASAVSGNKTSESYGGYDFWIVKLDANGNKRGEKSFGGDNADYLYSLVETSDGGMVLGGESRSGISGTKTSPNYGLNDFWVIKTANMEAPFGTPQIYVDGGFANAQTNLTFTETNSVRVDMITSFTNGLIYFTLDGSAPTSNSIPVLSVFWLANQSSMSRVYILRAIGYNQDYTQSWEADPITIQFIARPMNLVQQGQGTVAVEPQQPSYALGDVVTLTATPARWYAFSHWLSNGVPVMASTSLAVTIGLTNNYTAIFTNTVPMEEMAWQLWDRSYGGPGDDRLTKLLLAADGGFLLAGTSDSPSNGLKSSLSYGAGDYWLVRIDADGHKLWDRSYGGADLEELSAVRQTGDGGFIVGGYSYSGIAGNKSSPNHGLSDIWLVRFDDRGDKLWEASFGGDSYESAGDLLCTPDGGFVVAMSSVSSFSGNKNSAGYGGYDYWIFKLDAHGNKLWERSFGGTANDWVSALAPTSDGGFIVGGTSLSGADGNRTSPSSGGFDFWVVRLDADGNKVWEHAYGGSGDDNLMTIALLPDGNMLLGGGSQSPADGTKTSPNFGGTGYGDFWLVKIDSQGNQLWDRSYGGAGNDGALDLKIMGDGRLLLAGHSDSTTSGTKASPHYGDFDYWFLTAAPEGSKSFELSVGGSGLDRVFNTSLPSDGTLLLSGYSASEPGGTKTAPAHGSNDFWVVKLAMMELPIGTPQIWVNQQMVNGTNMVFTNSTPVSVILTSSWNGPIHYTLDGSEPDYFTAPLYTPGEPILVSPPATLKVIAYLNDLYEADQLYVNYSEVITAHLDYVPVYDFIVATAGGGTVTVGQSGNYLSNSTVFATATADPGWTFLGWSGDTNGASFSNGTLSVVMQSPRSIQAVFGTTVAVTNNVGGYVGRQPAGPFYPYGSTLRLTATPTNATRYFLGWSGAVTGPQNPIELVVTNAGLSVTGSFGALLAGQFSLNLQISGEGTVTYTPLTNRFASNATVTITAIPKPGHAFIGWSGVTTSLENPVTLTMNSNRTITANFGAFTAPKITLQPLSQTNFIGGKASFSFAATGVPAIMFQWYQNGNAMPSENNSVLQLSNLKLPMAGEYHCVASNSSGMVTSTVAALAVNNLAVWGAYWANLSQVPAGLSNVVAMAGGKYAHCLVLTADGRLIGWNQSGAMEVPTDLGVITAIAAGESHNLVLLADGHPAVWGNNLDGQTNMPAGLSNIIAMDAGYINGMALRADGTVVNWGKWFDGGPDQTPLYVPDGLRGVVAISAGASHSLALTSDGRVMAWGLNSYGQTNIPTGLSNVVAIAAGAVHSLALTADGRIMGWGFDFNGQATPPPNLTNVVAIAAGTEHSAVLTADGRVVVWGGNGYGQLNAPAELSNVVQLEAGGYHTMAMIGDGSPHITVQPWSRTAAHGTQVSLTTLAVGSGELSYQWYHNGSLKPGAVTAELVLTNISLSNAGDYYCIISNQMGSATSAVAALAVTPPPGMVLIPKGIFQMGDKTGEGNPVEAPVHEVHVSSYFMDQFETTLALWEEIRLWGETNGYVFDNVVGGVASNHPAYQMSWYDAVKWCNARSERAGLVPVYYTDTSLAQVYRSGQFSLNQNNVNWLANGYRLPTEAEWEKAARGGLLGHYYPWPSLGGGFGSQLDGSKANFLDSGDPYETNAIKSTPVGYYNGQQIPSGTNMANGYGLYDMAGNVWEWCWDYYDPSWYSNSLAIITDTRGPSQILSERVLRGGSFGDTPNNLRCSARDHTYPNYLFPHLGFRCVIGQVVSTATTPNIIQQPQSQTNLAGASVSFSVAANGAEPVHYQWQKSVISDQWSVIGGATNATFNLQPLTLSDAGDYRCVITNLYGVATSAVATLTVTNLPVNLLPLVSLISPTNNAVFRPGTNVVITANASDTDGSVTRVEFRTNGVFLAAVINPPYSLTWTNVALGTYALTAVAFDNLGSNTVSAPVTVSVLLPSGPAEFRLEQALYQVSETVSQVVVRVVKTTGGSGAINFATREGTAKAINADGYGDYQTTSGSLVFAPLDTVKTITIPIVDDLGAEGDQDFYLELSLTGDGSTLGTPASATLRILDDELPPGVGSSLEVRTPNAWPAPLGRVRIYLVPANPDTKWRFRWETEWRASGTEAIALEPGDYTVDFKAVSGTITPAPETFALTAGAALTRTNYYITSGQPVTGSLAVTLQPLGGRWRFQGQSTWYNSGAVINNIAEGEHVLEFEPVTGRLIPAPARVIVLGGQVNTASVYYPPLQDWGASTPAEPTVVNIASLQAQQNPYAGLGQLWTQAGYSSGYVVKERVVLTAAHALFNEADLSFVDQALWFFQRHKAEHEPRPQTSRGWYVFGGYAAARSNSPAGQSSLDAYHLDVAAVYFLQPAGRGGYGGYVVSDGTKNWLTGPENKQLLGYPVSGKDGLLAGKLYATVATPFSLDPLQDGVYGSANFRSYPGNSGGPLCVRHTNNLFYPAGIYLGESGPKSIVRLIDTNVVDLLNRAELSAHTGDNNTGGGVVTLEPGIPGTLYLPTYLQVALSPAEAVAAGAGWRLVGYPLTNYLGHNAQLLLLPGSYAVEFKPVAGWQTPTNRTAALGLGQTLVLPGVYARLGFSLASPGLGSNRVFSFGLSGEAGKVYVMEASTNLSQTNWTRLATNTLGANGTWLFADPTSTNLPARYYRAREK